MVRQGPTMHTHVSLIQGSPSEGANVAGSVVARCDRSKEDWGRADEALVGFLLVGSRIICTRVCRRYRCDSSLPCAPDWSLAFLWGSSASASSFPIAPTSLPPCLIAPSSPSSCTHLFVVEFGFGVRCPSPSSAPSSAPWWANETGVIGRAFGS